MYGDGPLSLSEYGGLYNWYAVDDDRRLCPSGWHVANGGDWIVMTDHLGGTSVAGLQMKTTQGWSNGGNGTNSSGFSGLPGGFRDWGGGFFSSQHYGGWWSSSLSEYGALHYDLYGDQDGVDSHFSIPQGGFSVRCIKDSE